VNQPPGEGQVGEPDTNQPVWQSIFDDPRLSRPPAPGTPGNVPPGDDLRLDIGWDRFEQLLVFVAQAVIGLNQVRFRRYGVPGQAQHGIDLAGRLPNRAYVVVQCKEYRKFTAADLRDAVEKFAAGTRPYGANHLIIAVSSVARTTQVEDELARLQTAHADLTIELWGAEQINDELRQRADIVSRFWTRETAETFCTGAPLQGVPAPPPNWIRVADQILLTPLGAAGLDEQLADAERARAHHPVAAAATFQQLADALTAEGYLGHAHVLRRKQLGALVEAGEVDTAAALAADLAATALHDGDLHQARDLDHLLVQLVRSPAVANAAPTSNDERTSDGVSAATARHAELIDSAVPAAMHQLADSSGLAAVLRKPPAGLAAPRYQPLLVLLLGELTLADAIITPPEETLTATGVGLLLDNDPPAAALAPLDDLIAATLAQAGDGQSGRLGPQVRIRLRLLRACYDDQERTTLLTAAQQLRLPRPHAALVLAAQARREALDGSGAEAVEHWRQAVSAAVLEGFTEDAADWLYSIRAVHLYFGPWTDNIEDEHLLAQALPTAGAGRLIRRVRDLETDARRQALDAHPIEAIRAARRWLADSIVMGNWAGEEAATELLGDLYARNGEGDRAASCYQWAGRTTKLLELARDAEDHLLPCAPVSAGPVDRRTASLAVAAAQQDLIDDDTAAHLLHLLVDLIPRVLTGEVIDTLDRRLLHQATKTAAVSAGRGSSEDAQQLLNLLATPGSRDASRAPIDNKQYVAACQTIAVHHQQLAFETITRIFDLADAGAHDALTGLHSRLVLDLLRQSPPDPAGSPPTTLTPLTTAQQETLRERLRTLASTSHDEASLALAELGDIDGAVIPQAVAARDRLLSHPEPDPHQHAIGTSMGPDAYLVTVLSEADQRACLNAVLAIAEDRREIAGTRREALAAAAVLVREQSDPVKAEVHARSRPFVEGTQDGSALDAETTNPHPLSSVNINLGPASLRGAGLFLAARSAVTTDERSWVREQAALLLGAEEGSQVRAAATALTQLGPEITARVDATLLAGHQERVVRELAAFVAAAEPARYAPILRALATDQDRIVRTQLAQQLHQASLRLAGSPGATADRFPDGCDSGSGVTAIVDEVLSILAGDPRHSVRRAAAGLRS
jgi:hypothetical protein